jgi:acyl dehydratase
VSRVFFEEVEVGLSVESPARTLTEADLVTFAAISGDYDPLATNEELARGTKYGGRVGSGLLGACIASGLASRAGQPFAILAFTGGEWKFHRAIQIGDTVRVRILVLQKRDLKGKEGGIVTERWDLVNQRDEVVQEARVTLLVAKRPTGS